MQSHTSLATPISVHAGIHKLLQTARERRSQAQCVQMSCSVSDLLPASSFLDEFSHESLHLQW